MELPDWPISLLGQVSLELLIFLTQPSGYLEGQVWFASYGLLSFLNALMVFSLTFWGFCTDLWAVHSSCPFQTVDSRER